MTRLTLTLTLALLLLPSLGWAGQKRDSGERCAFLRSHGIKDCRSPNGMIVDHVIALDCGGADSRWNMQLQTVEEAKAKDRWERKVCNAR